MTRKYHRFQESVFEREQRRKLHQILGDNAVDIILIALQLMENELNQFPDQKMEFGPELIVKSKDIEPIKEFLRYG